MINLEFLDEIGRRISIEYAVHPRSQSVGIPVPRGAKIIRVWLGTEEAVERQTTAEV